VRSTHHEAPCVVVVSSLWLLPFYAHMHLKYATSEHRQSQCERPSSLPQCFSTAGPRPSTGPWHQLYRTTRGWRKQQYATRFH